MSDAMSRPLQPLARPEILRDESADRAMTVVERPLSTLEWLGNQAWLRKILILVLLAIVWEIYGRILDNDLLFPTFSATVHAFYEGVRSGVIPMRAWSSRFSPV